MLLARTSFSPSHRNSLRSLALANPGSEQKSGSANRFAPLAAAQRPGCIFARNLVFTILLPLWLTCGNWAGGQQPPSESSGGQAVVPTSEKRSMSIQKSSFGKTSDGTSVDLYTLTNAQGGVVKLTNYGGILVSVEVPDRVGKLANVTLGFDDLQSYLDGHPFFGATVGRFCNRIAGGRFTLDGKTYTLAVNNGPNHLHGGKIGFDKLVWDVEQIRDESSVGVRLRIVSPDGDEGYPGKLSVIADYTWNNDNELKYSFEATCDQPTVLNLTNHAYWNLAGEGSGKIHDQRLQLHCDRYLAVDETLIPTGELANVAGTPLDFRQPRALGERIDELEATKGYDHCFVINGSAGQLRTCAIAKDPASGRVMEVRTTQPGVQLYTGNHLGGKYSQHAAFCLETQHYPDSPNQADFPSTRLNPGETFRETSVHKFSVE